jgi:hypothetical protein
MSRDKSIDNQRTAIFSKAYTFVEVRSDFEQLTKTRRQLFETLFTEDYEIHKQKTASVENMALAERVLVGSMQHNYSRGENEQDAMIMWLDTFIYYLYTHHPDVPSGAFYDPLKNLMDAMCDLRHGSVTPLFRPSQTSGRPVDGRRETQFKVWCVLASDELLIQKICDSRSAADLFVCRKLRVAAAALGIAIKPETIKGWRRIIGQGSVRRPQSAIALCHAQEKRKLQFSRKEMGALTARMLLSCAELSSPDRARKMKKA